MRGIGTLPVPTPACHPLPYPSHSSADRLKWLSQEAQKGLTKMFLLVCFFVALSFPTLRSPPPQQDGARLSLALATHACAQVCVSLLKCMEQFHDPRVFFCQCISNETPTHPEKGTQCMTIMTCIVKALAHMLHFTCGATGTFHQKHSQESAGGEKMWQNKL